MADKDYNPDWDNIPKEFKYCYVAKFEHGKCVQLRTHQKDQYHSTWIEHRRPPELVDGAWYACSESRGKFIGWYGAKDNLIGSGMEYYKPDQITIHQRIPDSMWEVDGENEMTDSEKLRRAFEDGASQRGYTLSRNESGCYEDTWLQEAWEIFKLIKIKKI